VRAEYELGKILGQGRTGIVRAAVPRTLDSGSNGSVPVFACKTIAKFRLGRAGAAAVRREVEALWHVRGHPNVSCLRERYEDAKAVHLIMDLTDGGTLLDALAPRLRGDHPAKLGDTRFTEAEAAQVLAPIAKAVHYCHSMGLSHRDVRMRNVLLEVVDDPRDDDWGGQGPKLLHGRRLKLADFGRAVFYRCERETDRGTGGSLYYAAPELLQGEHGREVDVWSLGVVLFNLLSGEMPFYGGNSEDITEKVLHTCAHSKLFDSDAWQEISGAAKQLVQAMLESDHTRRITVAGLLQHAWLLDGCKATPTVLLQRGGVHMRLKLFAAAGPFKQRFRRYLASVELAADQKVGLGRMFDAADTDKGGTLTVDKLKDFLAYLEGANSVDESELGGLLSAVGDDGSPAVDRLQFVAAALSPEQVKSCSKSLLARVARAAADGDGLITRQELRKELEAVLPQHEESLAGARDTPGLCISDEDIADIWLHAPAGCNQQGLTKEQVRDMLVRWQTSEQPAQAVGAEL
jgi:calcium-dependent protein kinase